MNADYLLEMLDSLAKDVENGWPADELLAHIDMIRAEVHRQFNPPIENLG